MKKLIKSLLILVPSLVSAQDVLYKTDNSQQEVKILEINETTIKYKVFNNLNGPDYNISKGNVAQIAYENGQQETITSPQAQQERSLDLIKNENTPALLRSKKYQYVTQNKNVFFLNTIEFLNSGLGVSYLREFGDGRFDLHIPFATSFGTPEMDNGLSVFGSNNHRLNKTHYDIGLGLYINTSGKRAITHFIGPLIRNSQYSGTYNWWNYDNYISSGGKDNFKMNETALMLNNGFLYRFTPKFNMMINIAVGKFVNRTVNYDGPTPGNYGGTMNRSIALHAGFHFGYRF